MGRKKKEAKFFCQCCGSEVPRNSKVCPTCGKFFVSVRCPQCGRTGTNDDFKNGCPTCGYAVNPDTIGKKGSGNILLNSNSGKSNIKYKNNSSFLENAFSSKNKSSYSDSSLPIWVYIVSIVALLIMVGIFYGCLTK